MKAAINGVLNCSILDGWWDEAYDPALGWAIGRGEEYANPSTADDLESQALYDLLEHTIIPMFYDRNSHGLPVRWVKMMKASIERLAPVFNTNRMVQEYTEKLYLSALEESRALTADGIAGAIQRAQDEARLRANWEAIRIEQVEADTTHPLGVRESLQVSADIYLGKLLPQDVQVQIYYGRLDNESRIIDGQHTDMRHEQDLGGGRHRYSGSVPTTTSGKHGFAVRVVPGCDSLKGVVLPGLIRWETQVSPAATAKVEKVA
ncbi:MAG: hypothetical protein Kow00105_03320 [Phycisphaeraceae bacterium]